MALCIKSSPAVQEVHLQCRRSWVQFLTETRQSQMVYAEDVGGPGQATTAQYLTDFFITMLLKLHRGHFALTSFRQYFLHGIGISRERFRYIAVTVLPQR